MARTVNSRTYDSPVRRAQAQRTRHAVLEAATGLFSSDGYVGTTIAGLATEAGVSTETVYAVFGTKRSILEALIDAAIAGDDAPTPVIARAWVSEMRDTDDPALRLRILAKHGANILRRVTPMYDVLQAAADSDPQIAALLANTKADRFAGQRELLRVALGDVRLPGGMNMAKATDVLFAVGSPETYRTLTGDRGWSAKRFERWYSDTLVSLILNGAR